MRFNDEELQVILRALKMNYIDGPDSEEHEEKLRAIISTIESVLGCPDSDTKKTTKD